MAGNVFLEKNNLHTKRKPKTKHSPLCRNPLHCIVPPHVLERLARERLAETGDERERTAARAALDTLTINESLRVARITKPLLERRPPLRGPRLFGRRRRALRSAEEEGGVAAALGFAKHRTIYSAQNRYKIPGVKVRSEDQEATNDLPVDEAYDYLGATFDFYANAYGRNSIDDEGMPLNATVHYGRNYDNALWDGRRMIFGDGDTVIFERFTIAVDVIGHELTHGVIEHDSGLIYSEQPGALNESVSDVFGSLVKQSTLNQKADQADWLIGEGLFIGGGALRSMKEPAAGFDPQPSHMRDYVDTIKDYGGVHINSGIPNHAFYLASLGIGGYAWQGAGLIWYLTLPFVPPTAQFQDFASLTLATAQRLFGVNSTEYGAVGEAWAEVGIPV